MVTINNNNNSDIETTDFYSKYYDKNWLLVNSPLFLSEDTFGKQAFDLLPVDTGIEIECCVNESTYTSHIWDSISNIVDNTSTASEQRLRIPGGLKGFNCLWEISKILNESFIKSNSGFHYHVDMADCFKGIVLTGETLDWVLTELDTWGYKGTYNKRNYSWVRTQSGFKTIEIRIGEMTFDYSQLCKRIIHCHYIGKYIRDQIENKEYYNYKKMLQDDSKFVLTSDEIIKNRIVTLPV